ncbi:MAG: hypothetical protein E6R13_07035 [Spirochaetes bacterium]|nr:MAG: hypothetical protein E6R13_07035 [Spirochaetota bacterium]
MLDLKVTDDEKIEVNSGKHQGTVFSLVDIEDDYAIEFDLMMVNLQVVPTFDELEWQEFLDDLRSLIYQAVDSLCQSK